LYVWILPAGFQDALSLLKQHADAAGVTIKTNRGQFNRFEILGPRAGQLLASAVFGKSQGTFQFCFRHYLHIS
jgi:glycine cleavage system aminomethyltransferase T